MEVYIIMGMFGPDSLLYLTIIFYAIAALAALVFSGHQRRSTLVSQGLCMVAAISGATAALVFLLSKSDTMILDLYHSSLPFLNFTLIMDGLSAFFLFILSILVFCVSLSSIGYLSHY